MRYFFKRNVFHPIIEVDGQPIEWERVRQTSGILATEDAKVIAVLSEAVVSLGGNRLTELDEAGYAALAKKNETNPQVTFVQQPYRAIDRTTGLPVKPKSAPAPAPKASSVESSAPPSPAVAKGVPRRLRRPVESKPVVESPAVPEPD